MFRAVKGHRSKVASDLRKIFINLYGVEWYNGVPSTMPDGSVVYFNSHSYIFDYYERGFINDAQLIYYLQKFNQL